MNCAVDGNQITVNWTIVSNSRMEKKAVFGTLADLAREKRIP
jgi:hypothetical protein